MLVGILFAPVTGIYQFNLRAMRFDGVGSGYIVICLGSDISGQVQIQANTRFIL